MLKLCMHPEEENSTIFIDNTDSVLCFLGEINDAMLSAFFIQCLNDVMNVTACTSKET